MAVHRIFLTLCLGAVCSLAYGEPNRPPPGGPPNFPTAGQSECEGGMGMMMCVAPVMGIAFSPEGQQLSQPGGKSQISETFYNTLCSTAQTVTTCAGGFLSRCAPAEKRADVQRVSSGVTKVLSVCNEPGSYPKFKKLVSCSEKIKTPMESCGRTAEAGVPDSQKLLSSGRGGDMEGMADNPPTQKQMCCSVKKFRDCIAPSVRTSCTAEERTVADKFGDRVLRAFDCTDAIYQTCGTA